MPVVTPNYEDWRIDYDEGCFGAARKEMENKLADKLPDYVIFRCQAFDPVCRRWAYQLRAIPLNLAQLFYDTRHGGADIERLA